MSAINFFDSKSSNTSSSGSCEIKFIKADKVIETPLKCFISPELKEKLKNLEPTDLSSIEKEIHSIIKDIEDISKTLINKTNKPRNLKDNGILFFENENLSIKKSINSDHVDIDLLKCSGNLRNCNAKNITELITILDTLKINSEISLSEEEW